jgi:L-arabinose isomerase
MIASRLVTSQVWLITGSQSMYGQDILDQVADQSRQIAERLGTSSEIPVEVRWLPVVTSSDDIARVLGEANEVLVIFSPPR